MFLFWKTCIIRKINHKLIFEEEEKNAPFLGIKKIKKKLNRGLIKSTKALCTAEIQEQKKQNRKKEEEKKAHLSHVTLHVSHVTFTCHLSSVTIAHT